MPTRRRFLASSGRSVAILAGAPALLLQSRREYDLVIRGGRLYDGRGGRGRQGDLAVTRGRIAAIGRRLRGRGGEEIDARGLAVSPGFIDIHSHADGTLFLDPRAESVIRQGITTVVIGADGGSRVPSVEGDASFAPLFARVREAGSSVNVASMVGLGRVRRVVIGEHDRPATPDELSRMTEMVRTALRTGACGASSGLEYTPGAYASTRELTALCRPLREYALPYATHMRDEEDRLVEAVDEAIAIAQGAGSRLQISHLKTNGRRNWPKIHTVLSRIERAKRAGLDVAFDRYPYVAASTGLMTRFPVWARDGGVEVFLRRLVDTSVAERIRRETLDDVEMIGGWGAIQITDLDSPGDRDAVGRRFDAWAKARGEEPYAAAVGLLTRAQTRVGSVVFGMSEENLERFLRHRLCMACTDGGAFATEGPARQGTPHPRGLGSYPRILGRYVRERQVITLADAIWKMTGYPASRLRLLDRGSLDEGLAADLVVFNPETVTDLATFESPMQYPAGIEAVVVNGQVVLRGGERLARGTGQPVRPPAPPTVE
jgi:N-acyl-D-amino-acid deacylase